MTTWMRLSCGTMLQIHFSFFKRSGKTEDDAGPPELGEACPVSELGLKFLQLEVLNDTQNLKAVQMI
ncbi:hypothetical protein chiPu_0002410 [Chiloscyllium punctatum]|uniref:Uncharacterized protein n=1 Tax=Chiloscyllium punctatum TaxID=137246 RepID=A0A401S0S6_CHIPU|nr:hypothetical protein [Chiloscyllium punctatum]